MDDNDFYPWGGVVPGVGKTTSTNTIKFTGKYRDATGLDYFGARYYANTTGRFMTPDWDAKPVTVPYANFGDPQSLNLYSYVGNSPIVRIDGVGHAFAGFDGFMAPKGIGGEPVSAPGSQNPFVGHSFEDDSGNQYPGEIISACSGGCSLQVTTGPLDVQDKPDGSMTVSQTRDFTATVDNGNGTTSVTKASSTTSITLPSTGQANAGQKPAATLSVTGVQTVTSNRETGQASYHFSNDYSHSVSMSTAYRAFGGPGTQGVQNGYQIVQNAASNLNQQRIAKFSDQLRNHAEGEHRSTWGHAAAEVIRFFRELRELLP